MELPNIRVSIATVWKHAGVLILPYYLMHSDHEHHLKLSSQSTNIDPDARILRFGGHLLNPLIWGRHISHWMANEQLNPRLPSLEVRSLNGGTNIWVWWVYI